MSNPNTPAETGKRLSAKAEAVVRRLRSLQASDPRVATDRKGAQAMLGCGSTYEIQLKNTGRLLAFLDGSQTPNSGQFNLRLFDGKSGCELSRRRRAGESPATNAPISETPSADRRGVRSEFAKSHHRSRIGRV